MLSELLRSPPARPPAATLRPLAAMGLCRFHMHHLRPPAAALRSLAGWSPPPPLAPPRLHRPCPSAPRLHLAPSSCGGGAHTRRLHLAQSDCGSGARARRRRSSDLLPWLVLPDGAFFSLYGPERRRGARVCRRGHRRPLCHAHRRGQLHRRAGGGLGQVRRQGPMRRAGETTQGTSTTGGAVPVGVRRLASVRNLGNFMFNLFHKYDPSKKYMNMISYMCLSNKFIIKDIMNIKLVLTSDA